MSWVAPIKQGKSAVCARLARIGGGGLSLSRKCPLTNFARLPKAGFFLTRQRDSWLSSWEQSGRTRSIFFDHGNSSRKILFVASRPCTGENFPIGSCYRYYLASLAQ